MSEIGWNMIFWMRVAMAGTLVSGAGEGNLKGKIILVKRRSFLSPSVYRDQAKGEGGGGEARNRNFTHTATTPENERHKGSGRQGKETVRTIATLY